MRWSNFKFRNADEIYNIRTHQNVVMGHSGASPNQNNADSYVQYIDNDPRKNGVYLDCLPTDDSRGFGWKFEQAEGYSATNKIYRLSTYGNRYLTATLDDADGNLCNAIAETSNSNYQVWKLVTVEEYYNLFDNSPSSVSAPIDISFLGKSLHLHSSVFLPTGRPRTTPSAFFLASASFVRWLIRFRSISAERPKAKASTLL